MLRGTPRRKRRPRRLQIPAPELRIRLEIASFAPLVPGVDEHDALFCGSHLPRLRDHRRKPASIVLGMRVDEDVSVVLQARGVVPADHDAAKQRKRGQRSRDGVLRGRDIVPDVALESRLGVQLELVDVKLLAEQLLQRRDQSGVMREEPEDLVEAGFFRF